VPILLFEVDDVLTVTEEGLQQMDDKEAACKAIEERVGDAETAGKAYCIGSLTIPFRKVRRMMKVSKGKSPAIFMTAVLEFLVAEILILTCAAAESDSSARIEVCHIETCVARDSELRQLMSIVRRAAKQRLYETTRRKKDTAGQDIQRRLASLERREASLSRREAEFVCKQLCEQQ